MFKIRTLGIDISLQSRNHGGSEFDIGLGRAREVKHY